MSIDRQSPPLEDDREERAREMARARKKRFDDRMRNADGKSGAERRRAVVIYLSDAATDVLRRNRLRRRLLELQPVLDSRLIEDLLLSFLSQGEPEQLSSLVIKDETKIKAESSNLLNKFDHQVDIIKSLEEQLYISRNTSSSLQKELDAENEFRSLDWIEVELGLLDTHRLLKSHSVYMMAQELRAKLANSQSDSQALGVVYDVVSEYIKQLIDRQLES